MTRFAGVTVARAPERVSGEHLALWAGFAILAAAAVLQLGFAQLAGDITWLMIVGERILQGDVLYRDIVEVNPPFSVALYLPAVWLEQATGLSARLAVMGSVFGLFAVSVWLARSILKRADWLDGAVTPAIFLPAVVLLFAPQAVFAQREHFGVIAFLPWFALAAARAVKGPAWSLPLRSSLPAGLLAALMVCVKPHYVLAMLAPAAVTAIRHRSLKPVLAPENLAAAAAFLAYAFIVWRFFPAYLNDVVPVLLDVYMPVSLSPLGIMLVAGKVVGFALPAVILLAWSGRFPAVVSTGLAVAAGFLSAFFLMSKGWDYHLLPAWTATGLTLSAAWRLSPGVAGAPFRIGRILTIAAAVQFAAYSVNSVWNGVQYTDRFAPLDVLPRGASIVAFTQEISLPHPAVSYIGAEWIERDAIDWVGGLARVRLEDKALSDGERARLEAHIAEARERKLAAMAKRPEIVMISPGDRWVREVFLSDPRIAATLENYRERVEFGRAVFYLRSDLDG